MSIQGKPAERKCWRNGKAGKVSYLIDGEEYFTTFREAAKSARHSIILLGWDFDSRFELVREDSDDGLPAALRDFLDSLAERQEGLHIQVLNWDFSLLLANSREWGSAAKMGWTTHERITFCYDAFHPSGGSHHQKLAVIDDRLAFIGGLDFALGRWDTRDHEPDDPRRAGPGGDISKPHHDVQAMLSGEIAAVLGDMARQRWLSATGETLEAPRPSKHALWPAGREPDLRDVDVSVARTLPGHEDQEQVREIQHQLLDAIRRAKRWIYIENQYFTAPVISEALAARLEEDDGPELVVVLPYETIGWLSQNTMDVLRERRIGDLREADRHGRLRVYYPHLPGLGELCINVHSKVMVVDDELLILGSANLNNRSLSLDSECNIAIEAEGKIENRAGIAVLRDRLLAEHLDTEVDIVSRAIDDKQSLVEAVESLTTDGRSLRGLPMRVSEEKDALVPSTELVDPEQALDSEDFTEKLVGNDDDSDDKSSRHGPVALASLLAIALLLAAAWRWTPLSEWVDIKAILNNMSTLRGHWIAPLAIAVIYTLGSLVMVPVTLMIVATGLAFGGLFGFGYALLGSVSAALVAYAIGHFFGRHSVQQFPGGAVSRASQFLGHRGLLAMITLRIVPVAPFTVVNLVAGASHISLRDFALGTLIGMVPGTLALVVLSDSIVAAIKSPDPLHIALIIGLVVLISLGSWGAKRWYSKREQ
ncbi:MAG: VTT domain-containing protein [Gammaproteobacteria bacterium]|nr:VTT domain-containing protein [Gammaproteobacteria bacterium]